MPGSPGTFLTRREWAVSFLQKLGNQTPTNGTVNFVVAWGTEEGGGWSAGSGGCAFNMLNTTQGWPGSTSCNKVGVRNFASVNDGIAANVQAIQNGRYPSLLPALRNNNEQALGVSGQMSPGVQQDLSVWATGSNRVDSSYVNAIQQLMGNPQSLGKASTNGNTSQGTQQDCGFDVGCWLNQAWQSLVPSLVSWGEHIAIFILAILLIIVGLVLIGSNPVASTVQKVGV